MKFQSTSKSSKSLKKPSESAKGNIHDGFRIKHLEVFNWGTFDQKVWNLEMDGYSALLTGSNGSGKSTLVDALLTLLVPNRKRNYNLSSGSDRRERSEQTYVRGAYGRAQNEFNQGETLYLRSEDQFSVLLATFAGSEQNSTLTIAQFFCIENGLLKKIFICSHNNLHIADHFSGIKSLSDLRNRLKRIPATEVFNKFADYEEYFVRHFKFRSRKGLDLFNQVTTIKEIGRLNEFVRQNMLDALDVPEQLEQLYGNYQHLSHAYQSILKAKRQILELTPIEDGAKELFELKQHAHKLQDQLRALPIILAHHRLRIFEGEHIKAVEKETYLEAESQQIAGTKSSIQKEEEELVIALNQEKGQQNLEKIDLNLKTLKDRFREKERRYSEYRAIAESLGYKSVPKSESFAKLQTLAQNDLGKTLIQLDEHRAKVYELKAKDQEISQHIQTLKAEAQSLQGRKNRLPLDLVSVREKIARGIGVSQSELYYVAELVKVNDDASKWAPVIEKVLFGFARRLLVPEGYIKKVNRFVRENHLGTRIVYESVNDSLEHNVSTSSQRLEDYIIGKLSFRPKLNGLTAWVKDKIQRDFHYLCTDDATIFAKAQRAITPEGLTKRGSQHEKDDRNKGEFRPILGWENQDVIQIMTKNLKDMETKLTTTRREIADVAQEIKVLETRRTNLETLLSLKHFEDINSGPLEVEMARLLDLKNSLAKAGTKTYDLRVRLEKVRDQVLSLSQKRDELLGQLGVIRGQKQRIEGEISQCRELLAAMKCESDQESHLLTLVNEFDKQLGIKVKDLSIEKVNSAQQKYQDSLQKKLQEQQKAVQGLSLSLVSQISQFKMQHAELTSHLTATIEALPGYLKIKESLDRESLPTHESRFRTLLNKSVLNDMLAFKSSLEMAYESIEESMNHLNSSLRHIPYTPTTHVQIGCVATRDIEIRDFQNLLRNAVSLGTSELRPIDLDDSFLRVKNILDRLKSDDRWRNKVIDVRNWAEFFVVEKTPEGEQSNFYSDSAGLSGGQKAKLAFTILASAVAFQYGLYQDGKDHECFRLVVIDEAFSKSDETNSQYAMDLFTKLGLQLIVITPRDKLYVVEPYVKRVFLTQIEGGQKSSVNTIFIEDFKANSGLKTFSATHNKITHEENFKQ